MITGGQKGSHELIPTPRVKSLMLITHEKKNGSVSSVSSVIIKKPYHARPKSLSTNATQILTLPEAILKVAWVALLLSR